MALPPIKRSTANKLAKDIRNSKYFSSSEKERVADFLAMFFKGEDQLFRADIFYNVATGTLSSDPAIKNPHGNNQWSKANSNQEKLDEV